MRAKKEVKKWGRWANYLLFPVVIIYLELIVRLASASDDFFGKSIWTMLLFSLAFGFLFTFLTTVWGPKANRIICGILLFLITLWIGVQTVYFRVFRTFSTVYSSTQAGNVFGEFGDQVLTGIWKTKFYLIFILLPFVLWLIFGIRHMNWKRIGVKPSILLAALFVVFQLVATLIPMLSTSGVMSLRYLYQDVDGFVPTLSVKNFGVLTTLRLDIRNLLFGDMMDHLAVDTDDDDDDDMIDQPPNTYVPSDEDPDQSETPNYQPNVMEIDFDALIANETDEVLIDMYEYFSQVEPTYENEYTGLFEGKNLIWIVAESFSSWALDETHTPTLCKLASEGFVFNNFYNPVWGVSTSDGEYVVLNSLLPKVGVWSFSKSSDNYMAFSMGNMLRSIGYTTKAYHNHTYTYYDRDKSHPNMGYDYEGVGNGLDMTNEWPRSDLEMIDITVPDYIDSQPFHVYYLTVSGHQYYTFMGNMQAYKHEDDVADLPYSEGPRAYIAANMELDLAMESLIEQLDEAGILEDTVIVLSGDHYPYGLEQWEIEELAGGTVEQNFELYRSTLIMWCADMEEPVQVDKYCSSLDILPTLCNLFDVEWDSRLLMGRDIFSDADPLVIFSNHSYITDKGRYNASSDTFTPNAGETVGDDYAREMLDIVNDKFEYSTKILDYDFYRHVFQPDS